MANQSKTFSIRVVARMLLIVIGIPLLPLLVSWRWDWREAWLYAIVSITGFVVSRWLASRRHADLLAERARFLQHEDAKAWDKLLAPLVGIGAGLIPLTAGLQALLAWSSRFSPTIKILALVFILAGYAWGSYALIENRFFSGMVRIQSERGQKVVSSGPYHCMRHPGYAGALLVYLATPFLLDSTWAFIPTLFITTVLIIRTRLEDNTLQDELPGYREYAQRVRYRLIPGIW